MDTALALLNATASAVITIALLAAILSPRVHDGVVIKTGLICMAAGFGSIALRFVDHSVHGMERSLALVNAGLAVVILGYLWRRARAGHPIRRTTDWSDLE